MMVLHSTSYKPIQGLVTETMGEEALILHLERNTCFALNAVGAVVWQRLNAGDDAAQIARHVETRFEATAAQALQDVVEFIEHLLAQGLIEPR